MILDTQTPDKPHIDYPCEWGFKLIGKDAKALEDTIADILSHKEYRCHLGNASSNGKFISYNAYCHVDDEAERNALFKSFESHQDVKMVM
ncbi:MAG: hypothetical protein KU28_11820 [Sulfurovum sp. PC08-66]|jgi:putative lipoic acid-binding regulatory protein|nr:MAG: hypothetical protein KU28_11820 [Sulfurovum sp. PC08-66]